MGFSRYGQVRGAAKDGQSPPQLKENKHGKMGTVPSERVPERDGTVPFFLIPEASVATHEASCMADEASSATDEA